MMQVFLISGKPGGTPFIYSHLWKNEGSNSRVDSVAAKWLAAPGHAHAR